MHYFVKQITRVCFIHSTEDRYRIELVSMQMTLC
jgi:hypothetical protein